MKFALSFSGGKDSVHALHKAIQEGHEPVALLVMFREDQGRSWVHGIDRELFAAVAQSLKIPLICHPSTVETYRDDMEAGLNRVKLMGAEACVFGDIDTEEHRQWDCDRCKAVGLKPLLPLWGMDRLEAVRQFLSLGYQCIIKCISRDLLPESLLGSSFRKAAR